MNTILRSNGRFGKLINKSRRTNYNLIRHHIYHEIEAFLSSPSSDCISILLPWNNNIFYQYSRHNYGEYSGQYNTSSSRVPTLDQLVILRRQSTGGQGRITNRETDNGNGINQFVNDNPFTKLSTIILDNDDNNGSTVEVAKSIRQTKTIRIRLPQ